MTTAELMAACFGAATAFATGISAFVLWQQWRGGIYAEWEPSWSGGAGSKSPRTLEIIVTVRNDTKVGVRCWKVAVSGVPLVDVKAGNPPAEKHQSWSKAEAPVSAGVDPGQSARVRVTIWPDWSAILTRKSWRVFSKSYAVLRIQISIASKARRRMVRRTTKINIPKAMIAAEATNKTA
jgi:hypothetical protein